MRRKLLGLFRHFSAERLQDTVLNTLIIQEGLNGILLSVYIYIYVYHKSMYIFNIITEKKKKLET